MIDPTLDETIRQRIMAAREAGASWEEIDSTLQAKYGKGLADVAPDLVAAEGQGPVAVPDEEGGLDAKTIAKYGLLGAGGVAGLGAAGFAASQAGPWATQSVRAMFPAMDAKRELGRSLTREDLERARRQEQLAPGSVVPAELGPRYGKTIRPIARGDRNPMQFRAEAQARVERMRGVKQQINAQYPAPDTPVPVTPELQRVLLNRGYMPGATVRLEALRNLRTRFRQESEAASNRLQAGNAKAGDADRVRQYAVDADVLTTAMEQTSPDFRATDRDYSIASSAEREARRTAKVISDVQAVGAPNVVMGNTPTSAAGTLSTGGDVLTRAINMLTQRTRRGANAIGDVYLTPTTLAQLEKYYARANRVPFLQRVMGRGRPPILP